MELKQAKFLDNLDGSICYSNCEVPSIVAVNDNNNCEVSNIVAVNVNEFVRITSREYKVY